MCLNIAVEYRDSKCVISSVLVSLSVVVHSLTIMNSKNVKNGWSGRGEIRAREERKQENVQIVCTWDHFYNIDMEVKPVYRGGVTVKVSLLLDNYCIC